MTQLNDIREVELAVAVGFLPSGGRILELGSGSGYQAHRLVQLGYSVVGVDLASRPTPAIEYHPIESYDGVRIPYPDGSFDAVFSSNVLEHVTDLPRLLADACRVLAPGGVGVHLMPTPTWRAGTMLTHYPEMLRRAHGLVMGTRRDESSGGPPAGTRGAKPPYLVPGPHGEASRTAVGELFAFSERAWNRTLEANGFVVSVTRGGGLFYTGHLLTGLSIESRRRLARALGSSCRLYVTHPV